MLRPGGLGPASPAPLGPARGLVAGATGRPDGPSPCGLGFRAAARPPHAAHAQHPHHHQPRRHHHHRRREAHRAAGCRSPATPSVSSSASLVGQRVDGDVRVTDEPATGQGRSYLVESELESKAALDALVSDYIAKSQKLDYPAMHGWF